MRRTTTKLLITAASLILAGAAVVAANPAASGQQENGWYASGDWSTWQKDPAGTRFNAAEHDITPATVKNLKLKWAYAYNPVQYARVGSQPAVVDGTLYVGAPDAKFVALDAKTGSTKWTFDLTTVVAGATNGVRDGAAVAGDSVYFGDSTGRVYSLDIDNGALNWVRQVDTHPKALETGSPLVYRGHVYIGTSTGEGSAAGDPNYPCCTHVGEVVSLDADTGDVTWRHAMMPPAKEMGTWPSGAKKYGPSGASVWSSPVLDEDTGILYVGTGNNSSGQGGDIDSLVAIKSWSGETAWKQQVTFPDTYTTACGQPDPGEYCPGSGEYAHDWDVTSPTLLTVGRRKIITVGQKSGTERAFDAHTGKLLWENQLVPPAETNGGSRGVEWSASTDGKLIYVATWLSEPGKMFALDPATGKVVWEKDHPADGCTTGGAAAYPDMCGLGFTPAMSGTPGLLYEGSADGKMRIFDSTDGSVLWQFDAVRDFQTVNGPVGHGSAISGNGGAVISDGMVYVEAGYYPFYPTDKGKVLLAFGL